ncbi:uncharacterized protein LOC134300798 [Trichomycterus rosablanca]|uniref:uncharacterized protein LOC134300798 n=1 Tax=Trichomycterus rosablanca TaxID=2290929 RepID=UPI002F353866
MLLIFLHHLQLIDGDVHSISGYFLGSQGLNLPGYIERITVDDVTVFHHNSSMKSTPPCPKWLNSSAGQHHWNDISLISQHNKQTMNTNLQSAIQQFNLTGSVSEVNIYQGFSRCELYPDGTLKALLTHAFNGKDFLSLDIDRKTFVASAPQALSIKRQRESDQILLDITASFYKKTCFDRLKIFLNNAPALKIKKVPEVRIIEVQRSGSTLLTCHVTGFYPRAVRVEWTGPNLLPVDEGMNDALPNNDGTYQTRRSVIRPEEETEDQIYSCVVHHSSVPENITLTWDKKEKPSTLAYWILLPLGFFLVTAVGLVIRCFCKPRDLDKMIIYVLLFLLHPLLLFGDDVYSLSGNFIGCQGLNLPDYMERVSVNDVTVFYHDDSMKSTPPCPEWLNSTDGQHHWNNIIARSHLNRLRMNTALQAAIQQFNLTGSTSEVNVYQGFFRCDLYPNGTRSALLTHAFNGKDFLSLDIDSKTFVASTPQAVPYKRHRESDQILIEIITSYYRKTCFDRLKIFLDNAPALKIKKVPEIRIIEVQRSGSTLLTCHVTSFYPRAVRVEWSGPNLQAVDEGMNDALPNNDGTYQTRRSVIRPEEETEDQIYSCVVHHSSVPGNITLTWDKEEKSSTLIYWILILLGFFLVTAVGLVIRCFYKHRDASKIQKSHKYEES